MLRGQMCLTRPKSITSQILIPLPAPLVETLRQHRRVSIAQPKPFGLVWADPTGSPMKAADDLAGWYEALAAAQVRRVPLHSARHTTATLLIELGVDVTVIQSTMGHSDATTTQLYQHSSLTMERKALDGLGSALTTY